MWTVRGPLLAGFADNGRRVVDDPAVTVERVSGDGARVLRLVPPIAAPKRRIDTRPLLAASLRAEFSGPNKGQMRQAVHVLDYAAGVLRRLRDESEDADERAALEREWMQLQEARTTVQGLAGGARQRMPRGPHRDEWS